MRATRLILLLVAFLLVAIGGCSKSGSKSSCPSPFSVCGTTCTATSIDPANCGTCGTACGAGQRCVSGTCTLSCSDGLKQCGSTCVDPMTSNANCGDCGKACSGGQMCSGGSCSATCASGYTACTSYCADTVNDSQNCGACGTVCPSGQRCASSGCTASCASGRMACGGACVDVSSDPANCGACGTVCLAGEACQAGACTCGVAGLALGKLSACAVRTDGSVVCWGGIVGGTGGVNVNNNLGSTGPQTVAGFSSVKALDTDSFFACALKTDGTVACAGNDDTGELGDGRPGGSSPSPRPVLDSVTPTVLSSVAQISTGQQHACALKTNGEIWCWGSGTFNDLADDSVDSAIAIKSTLPAGLTNIKKVIAADNSTFAIDGNGAVWCWGRNDTGQCGSGVIGLQPTPAPIAGLAVTDLVSNNDHVCAIKTDKTVVCWGRNDHSQTGVDRAVTNPVISPSPVPVLTDVVEIATGTAHSCARKSDGTVWCWGCNSRGELGSGTIDLANGESDTGDHPSVSPVPVLTEAGTPLVAKSLALNHNHSCAIVGTSNHPYCWGNNRKGQAGLVQSMSGVARPIYSCGF